MKSPFLAAIFFIAVCLPVSLATHPARAADFCHDEEWMSFEDWRAWESISDKPVLSLGHGNNWVGIFANELARDVYLSAGAPYPECAAIAKAIYYDDTGEAVRKLTVMVKMPAGYDPEHGDWWYGSVDSTGTMIREGGRLEGCMSCHEVAAANDYVFSDSVLETIREWKEWSD